MRCSWAIFKHFLQLLQLFMRQRSCIICFHYRRQAQENGVRINKPALVHLGGCRGTLGAVKCAYGPPLTALGAAQYK